jgi:hypothetical protein
MSPFYPNYGFEPRTNWPTVIQFSNPASEFSGHYMSAVHSKLSKLLEQSIEAMQKYYNKERKSVKLFKKRELVMLNGRNIRAKHCSKKLQDEMYWPFVVIGTEKMEGIVQ